MLKDRDKTRLQAAEMKVLRRVVGVTRLDGVCEKRSYRREIEAGSNGSTGEEKKRCGETR